MSKNASLASVPERLGKPLQVFKSGGGENSRFPAYFLTFFFFVCLAASVIGAISGKAPPWLPLLPAAFTGLFLYLAIRPSEYAGWTIVLCERGILSTDNRKTVHGERRLPKDIAWDDIASIRSSVTRIVQGWMSEDFEYHILGLPNGEMFDLTSALLKIKKLGEVVQEEVYKRLRPRLIEASRAGQTLDFGVIETSSRGMQVQGQLLPWEGVTGVTIQQATLNIQHGVASIAIAPIPISEVKNLPILWEIFNERLGPRRMG